MEFQKIQTIILIAFLSTSAVSGIYGFLQALLQFQLKNCLWYGHTLCMCPAQ